MLDVKTTFRLQKPHCANFWWKHIKNESCKWYLDNKEQEVVFVVVSRMCTLLLSARYFVCPIENSGAKKQICPPLVWANVFQYAIKYTPSS